MGAELLILTCRMLNWFLDEFSVEIKQNFNAYLERTQEGLDPLRKKFKPQWEQGSIFFGGAPDHLGYAHDAYSTCIFKIIRIIQCVKKTKNKALRSRFSPFYIHLSDESLNLTRLSTITNQNSFTKDSSGHRNLYFM